MDLEKVKEWLGGTPNLATRLGMEFHSTPEPDVCVATMKVDERTRQPFGVLSGGATVALAETLAGVGSLACAPGVVGVGINVGATHVRAAREGDTVTAQATLVGRRRHFHVWQVTVTDGEGQLVSTLQVTNFLKPLQECGDVRK